MKIDVINGSEMSNVRGNSIPLAIIAIKISKKDRPFSCVEYAIFNQKKI